MMAATRSRLESSAAESTPRLPVTTVRKIFSDTNTIAAPTEASAAVCFAELGFELEMAASRAMEWPDAPARCPFRARSERRRRDQRQTPRFVVRSVHLDLIQQQRRRNHRTGHAVIGCAEDAQGRTDALR